MSLLIQYLAFDLAQDSLCTVVPQCLWGNGSLPQHLAKPVRAQVSYIK